MKNNIIKIIIALAVIIAGIAIMVFSHFQFGLYYSKNVRVEIYLGKSFEQASVEAYVKEALPEQKVLIEVAGAFKDTISITTTEITDEQLEQIVNKLNEVYETKLTVLSDTFTIYNSNVRGRDIFGPYLAISVVVAIIVIAIIAFMYGKTIGYKKVILTTTGIALSGQFFYFVVLALTKVNINKMIPGVAAAIFIASMVYLMSRFERIKEEK